jgi:glyoxylase-like metal-dependent hydrolase (beta-lactamase superfamily II)/rhodanese-related sulfurtransferase
MYIEQIYTSCLSEASYYVESEGHALVIDPLRDTDVYLKMAKDRGAKIEYILETHFHADFVSGHLELANQTGASIVYGPNAKTGFEILEKKDGDIIPLGKISIQVLHTPGHTMESTCYLLLDENKKQHCVFTGDTLFVGDVGRPDLFGATMTKEELAGYLYESLTTKIKTLADDVIVYPAHGAGSSCGKNLGKETFSTIGAQKSLNYALQDQTKEQFIKAITEGLSTPPVYFPENARINREGYTLLKELKAEFRAMSVEDIEAEKELGTLILDTRPASEFTEGFIPESMFIGIDGRFAEWAGSLIPLETPIVLVTEPGKEEESMIRLTRVGFDHLLGYFEGGFKAWLDADKSIDMIINVDADELKMDMQFDSKLGIIDVRKPGEFEGGHVQGAENISLVNVEDTISGIPEDHNLYVHCAGGYRSVIAASIMKRHGIHNLRNVLGGWSAISAVPDMPIVVPSKNIELN